MIPARRFALVLVTAPNVKVARMLVRLALENRLAACGNIIPGVESHYWWEKKIDRAEETLILFKTTTQSLKALEALIVSNHPYDVPEFVVLPLEYGSQPYLHWIRANVGPPKGN